MERDTVSEGRDSQMERAPVEEQSRGHLFGQVYNRKQKDVLDVVEATNPNLVSSPDDPSPMSDELPIALRKGTRFNYRDCHCNIYVAKSTWMQPRQGFEAIA
ncbi:hypothetical protein EJ110_NYTH60235 [Nymphaea thermarum]|nr:hypothetical protein EJ110_NYTH60235 [Nymphaea thermarum]